MGNLKRLKMFVEYMNYLTKELHHNDAVPCIHMFLANRPRGGAGSFQQDQNLWERQRLLSVGYHLSYYHL